MKVKVLVDTKWNKWIRDNQKSNNSKNFSTETLNSIFNIRLIEIRSNSNLVYKELIYQLLVKPGSKLLQLSDDIKMKVIASNFLSYHYEYISYVFHRNLHEHMQRWKR